MYNIEKTKNYIIVFLNNKQLFKVVNNEKNYKELKKILNIKVV